MSDDAWVTTTADTLRRALQSMVDRRQSPGAVAAIGSATERAFVAVGTTAVDGRHPATPATFYDIASLTKVVATWPLVGRAVADQLVDLDTPVAAYFDVDPGTHPGAAVTLRQVLTHTSGLKPSTRLDRYIGGDRDIAEAILAEPLDGAGGHRYINRGFILTGLLLERLRGATLGELLDAHTSELGTRGITYGPLARGPKVAPTERRLVGGHPVHGTAHDENAATLGGMAGHAGVFATADALADYAEAILRTRDTATPFGAYVRASWQPAVRVDERTHRGLAWLLTDTGLVYHHGFTGTSLYFHPVTGRYLVLLTNAIAYGRARPGLTETRKVAAGVFG
ncbi:serine hydrolase domain-containing protein [Marinitenerispora sediminis]|uniref:Esterase n=1 Tax=Marinitenerispora sediminis TaxID=1931232 RepID=A0A368T9Q9_9ACTN|nr:serine hydrolase domain-containing protein [Marinitenerispora sediminis]RCV58133.1 esterase [Marinitenerispora sediminis]RCV58755.1 esterase [Marinitenerispora sediminis]RCV61406.1 esterase [Marinitenerispora sediminis]